MDDIEAGRSPLGDFIKGEKIYTDLLAKVTELQRGIHVAEKEPLGNGVQCG